MAGITSEKFFDEPVSRERVDAFGRKVMVKFEDEIKLQAEDQRSEMIKLGNQLVTLTEHLLKQGRQFFRSFNRRFTYVVLEHFIFHDADYMQIAVKEVEEITAIFASYDLVIREMQLAFVANPVVQDSQNKVTEADEKSEKL